MAKVLLVEPDRPLGNTLSKALKHFGHQVVWRRSAESAIHAIDQTRPDVIILELQLPTHNGVEFLYELRSYHDWQNLPVIIHSQVPPVMKAISPMLWDNLGITAYLYKPLTKLAQLNSSIQDILLVS